MRKLRRLPWRIPKSDKGQPRAQQRAEPHQQSPSIESAEVCARADRPHREPEISPAYRETVNTQPVAFAGGRYVYGDAPSVACPTEIRRKTRHRVVPLGTLTPQT